MNKRGDLLKMNWYRVCVDEVRSLTPCRRRFVCRPSCRAVLRADETMVKGIANTELEDEERKGNLPIEVDLSLDSQW
jgi:hypothetical protein